MGEGQDTEVAVGLEPVWGRGLNDLVPEKARDVVQLEPDEADPPVVRRVPVVHCQPQAGPRGWGKQPVCASGVFHFQLNIYRQKKNVGRNRAHGGYLSYPCPYPPPFIFHQIGFDGRIVGPHSSMLKSLQRLLWTGENLLCGINIKASLEEVNEKFTISENPVGKPAVPKMYKNHGKTSVIHLVRWSCLKRVAERQK